MSDPHVKGEFDTEQVRAIERVIDTFAGFGSNAMTALDRAIVAPSIPAEWAYDNIQPAIDDGYRDIWLCEDITENNIAIPPNIGAFGAPGSPFRIRGMAESGAPTITDPQDGNPVFYWPGDGNLNRAIFRNFGVDGGTGSGPIFDFVTGVSEGSKPAFCLFQNIKSRGGPWRLWAGRHIVWRCANQNVSDTAYTIQGKDIYPAIETQGATFAMYGGQWNTTRGEDTTALSSGAFEIGGGATFNNQSDEPNRSALTILGSSRGTFHGFSCEGDSGTTDLRIGFDTVEANSPGMTDSVFVAPSWGGGDGTAEIDINQPARNCMILAPNKNLNFDLTVSTEDVSDPRGTILVIAGDEYSVSATGPFASDISRIGWSTGGDIFFGGVSGSSSAVTFDILSSPPDFTQPASKAIADGANWDPAGNGNAAVVIRNAADDAWLVDQDLGGPL